MPVVVSSNSYDTVLNVFKGRWVDGHDLESLRFCVSIVCPTSLANETDSMGLPNRIDFETGYLNADGKVSSSGDMYSIPLNGLSVLWFPGCDDVTTRALADYFNARNPAQTNTKAMKETKSRFRSCSPEEAASLLRGKKVLVFTGAGISMAAGLPDLKELCEATVQIFEPFCSYLDDVVHGRTDSRSVYVRSYFNLFTETEPTEAHYLISELCDKLGCDLATGNFDSLHQKTGLQPIFQNTGDVVIPTLEKYDYILTIGLNDGIGLVKKVYKEKNPHGRVIAIAPDPPQYLAEEDYHVSEAYSHALSIFLSHL